MAINTYSSDKIQQSYTSMSGCDIQAFIESVALGNIQGVSFSITREKAPIYVMGSVDPVSFSRGIYVCLSTLLKTVKSKLVSSMTIPWVRDNISMPVQTC